MWELKLLRVENFNKVKVVRRRKDRTPLLHGLKTEWVVESFLMWREGNIQLKRQSVSLESPTGIGF